MDTKRRPGDAGPGRATASGSRPRVLLCVADAGACEAARTALEAAGYAVCTSSDRAATCEPDPPAFALLDLDTDRNDTMELAPRLAAAGVPFVFTAAAGDDTLTQRAVDAGAIGCFVRPIDVSILVPSIAAWQAHAAELRRLVGQERALRDALQTSRQVGTAVGMLMQREGIDAERAFDMLRRRARDERLSVRRVAARIVEQRSAGPDPGSLEESAVTRA